jgi:hypothetical protein
MSGTILPLPSYVFVAYTGASLLLLFHYKSSSQSILTGINNNYRQHGKYFPFILQGDYSFIKILPVFN